MHCNAKRNVKLSSYQAEQEKETCVHSVSLVTLPEDLQLTFRQDLEFCGKPDFFFLLACLKHSKLTKYLELGSTIMSF